MTAKLKAVKSIKKTVDSMRVDTDQAQVFFSVNGKEYIVPMLPIDDRVLFELAGERMHQLVKGAKDPYEKAEWVRAGRPKKVYAPAIVYAIAETSSKSVSEVLKIWKKLSKAEKARLKADPVVIANIKRLETPIDPQPTDLLLDVFM